MPVLTTNSNSRVAFNYFPGIDEVSYHLPLLYSKTLTPLYRCPRAARPSIKGMPAVAAEPYGEEALEFIKDQIMHREVEIEVESCDKAGNFIGYLFVEDTNMSVELVKEGLATMHFTAERGKYFDLLSRYMLGVGMEVAMLEVNIDLY